MDDRVKKLLVATEMMKAMMRESTMDGVLPFSDETSSSCLECHYAVGSKDGDVCLMQSREDAEHKIPWREWNPEEMPLDKWCDPSCPLKGGGRW